MRLAGPLFATVTTLAVLTAMADPVAESATGDAKAALTELVTDGEAQVHEESKQAKAGKPRFGSMGIRQSWNECVGMLGVDAVAFIKEARPDLKKVVMVREGSMVTMDMRMDRVRVWCDADGIVTRPPRIG